MAAHHYRFNVRVFDQFEKTEIEAHLTEFGDQGYRLASLTPLITGSSHQLAVVMEHDQASMSSAYEDITRITHDR